MTAQDNLTAATQPTPKMPLPDWIENLLGQLLAIFISLAGGAIIILLVGENPVHVFATLVRGALSSTERLAGTLLQATPIIVCGVAACVALRGGLFNIGVEGQLYLGGFAASWVGFAFTMPPVIHMIVAMFAAIVAGACGY
ncbi:MAG: hypothetical protein ACTHLK_00510 [Brucella intermedia]